MKLFFAVILFCSSLTTYSQVPEGQKRVERYGSGMGGDTEEAIPMDGFDRSRTVQFIREGKKMGLKRQDSILVPPIYDQIVSISSGYKIKKDAFWGLVDKNGKLVLETKFDSIGEGLQSFIVKKGQKYGAFKMNGLPLVAIKFAKILYSNGTSGLTLIKNNKQELQLLVQDKVSTIAFDHIIFYQNAAIISKNQKNGLLMDGQMICPIEYDNISVNGIPVAKENYFKKTLEQRRYVEFRDIQNIFILEKEKKMGVLLNKEFLYPVDFDKVLYDTARRLLVVQQGKLKGLYLIGSQQKTEIIYDDIQFDGTEFIELKKNKRSSMVDYKLNVVLPMEYDDIQIQGFNSGFKIFKDKKQGWTTRKGEVLIPPLYDEIDNFNGFSSASFKDLLIVKIGEHTGVVDKTNKAILPVVFEHIFERNDFIGGKTKDGKFGLYKNDGTVILPPEYDFIFESIAEGTKLLYAKKQNTYTFIDKSGAIIFNNTIKKYGYIEDEFKMINPLLDGKKSFLRVQDGNGKYGIYDERSEKQCLPFVYDAIKQKFISDRNAYFLVQKGSKYGVVNDENKIIIPFDYQDLRLDLLTPTINSELVIPAKKGGKYGLINFENKVLVAFKYQDVARISNSIPLFKAKTNTKYNLINQNGIKLSEATFDEIANFEEDEALTFDRGEMKVINAQGQFTGQKAQMTMHVGYLSFEDLKQALIQALDSPDDQLLMDFCKKIAPSKHLLYYLKFNIFDKSALAYGSSSAEIAQQYFKELYQFKKRDWHSEYYRKTSLTHTDDYTVFDGEGFVTNKRATDWAFGDTRFMEKLLRNAIKINGYWISTYFMKRYFSVSAY